MIKYSSIEEVINKEGYIITGFEGYSMYPTFLKDDLLVIIKTNEYSTFDPVLYKNNDSYFVHRIIDIKGDFYIIRGDNTINDELISKDLILGKVASIIRNKEEIKLSNDINIKDYNKSLKSLKYRKFKAKIKKFLKYE